jgi:hypothetical protein
MFKHLKTKPYLIMSDNDSSFTGLEFQKLLTKMNGNELVSGLVRTDLKDIGIDMIINKLVTINQDRIRI